MKGAERVKGSNGRSVAEREAELKSQAAQMGMAFREYQRLIDKYGLSRVQQAINEGLMRKLGK